MSAENKDSIVKMVEKLQGMTKKISVFSPDGNTRPEIHSVSSVYITHGHIVIRYNERKKESGKLPSSVKHFYCSFEGMNWSIKVFEDELKIVIKNEMSGIHVELHGITNTR